MQHGFYTTDRDFYFSKNDVQARYDSEAMKAKRRSRAPVEAFEG
jgi:hypothetical protein